jgi:phosphoribosylglycinamide formyltransferase 1
MKNIVILISGAGSNLQAIVNAAHRQNWGEKIGARVACVISNRPDAEGLVFARANGLATDVVDHKAFTSREAFDNALAGAINRHGQGEWGGRPALVVLAGFMRILTPGFVKQFEGRLVNIHPSLLPAFTGLNTHQRAIDAGCQVAGVSVHWVTTELDGGRILAQAVVPVLPNDTATSLGQRVLGQEHLLYPKVIFELLHKV